VYEEIASVLEAEADRLERRKTRDTSDENESKAAVPRPPAKGTASRA
jgi:hypothetical protein